LAKSKGSRVIDLFQLAVRLINVMPTLNANFSRNNFIVALITPPIAQNTGYWVYLFFAVFCIIAGAWTRKFVPETNNMALEEMYEVFGDAVDPDAERARWERIWRGLEDGEVRSPVLPPTSPAARSASNANRV
jgi:hypothetical protein